MSNRDNDTAGGRRGQLPHAPEGFSALSTGTRLSERYVVESVIGAGGFGITYLARHEALGKPYAIKDGHERMIAILDSIAYYADPLECYNLNSKYVEIIRKELKKLPNDELPLARTRFAEQLIYAGKPGQAIIELTTLTHDQGDSITEANKEMYEFLALAYLRLGEVNNCVERHNAESCIVPVQPDGYYTDMIGLKNAIKVYQRLLESFPNDSQNRWLLNIAYMNQGQYPDSVPEAWRIDPRVFKSPTNGIKFTNQAVKLGIDANGISGSVCMDDFDNDGDLDLFITRYGLRDQCRYFVNEKGKFKDRTDAAHLPRLPVAGHAAQPGNLCRDGHRRG